MSRNEKRGLNQIVSRSYNISPFIILASAIVIGRAGRAAVGGSGRAQHFGKGRLFCNAFVVADSIPPSISRSSSTETTSDLEMSSGKKAHNECQIKSDRYSYRSKHVEDQSLWIYHVESTTSTMDEAKLLIETKFANPEHVDEECTSAVELTSSEKDSPKSFIISATSQSNGRGTSKRNWKSSQTGNALFTIGIQQSAWMNDLKSRNDGRMVPLTLLPLKVGSVVAFHVQKFLMKCASPDNPTPKVTVKWPNDVLLYNPESQSAKTSHEKVAGILIESSQDWFLIGIGINVGYAPDIPLEGIDYGRKATSLSQYCKSNDSDELFWIETSKELGRDVAHDIHSWLHPFPSLLSKSQMAETILSEWKSFVDWDMELVLRDTPKREKVTLKQVLEDGRVVVEEVETGLARTLVSDYFL